MGLTDLTSGMLSSLRGVTDFEVRMEYFNPGDNVARLHYEGINYQGRPTSDNTWVIRRLEWSPPPGGVTSSNFVTTRIQVLIGVWDNRATLPWS